MKKLVVGLMVVGLIGLAGLANAQQASTSTVIKVTCAPALSVSVDIPEYDFGGMNPGATQISSSSATITNDSTGRTEDYTIDCSTYTADWAIDADGTPGDDAFSLQALFMATPPSAGNFAANDFLDASGSSQNMDDPAFTVDASSYDGDNIAKDTQRVLWFRMHTPANTTSQSEQSVTVTITAVDASSF